MPSSAHHDTPRGYVTLP